MHKNYSKHVERMLKRFSEIVIALVSFGFIFGNAANATTIDFESTPTGIYTSLTFGTATFTYLGGNGKFNVDIANPGAPVSGHSLISYFQNPGAAPFKVAFSSAIDSFTIGSGDFDADQDHVHLIAFDALNNVVDTASYFNPATTYGGSFLTVSGANITSVQFYEDGPFAGAIYWDNVSFREQDNGGTVPEPQSLALFSLGLFGFAVSQRKRSKNGRS